MVDYEGNNVHISRVYLSFAWVCIQRTSCYRDEDFSFYRFKLVFNQIGAKNRFLDVMLLREYRIHVPMASLSMNADFMVFYI